MILTVGTLGLAGSFSEQFDPSAEKSPLRYHTSEILPGACGQPHLPRSPLTGPKRPSPTSIYLRYSFNPPLLETPNPNINHFSRAEMSGATTAMMIVARS
jgi:hypothetical protein